MDKYTIKEFYKNGEYMGSNHRIDPHGEYYRCDDADPQMQALRADLDRALEEKGALEADLAQAREDVCTGPDCGKPSLEGAESERLREAIGYYCDRCTREFPTRSCVSCELPLDIPPKATAQGPGADD